MGKVVKKVLKIGIAVAIGYATGGLAIEFLLSQGVGVLAASAIAGAAGGLVGYSAAHTKKPNIPGAGDLWGNLQLKPDPSAPRYIIYGETTVGGTLVYRETLGTNNNTLWMVIVLAGHEIDSITGFKWGGESVSFSSGAATGTYSGLMYRYDKLGTDAQTVETNLDSASTNWTTNHRLRGIAYVTMKLVFDEETLNEFKNTLFKIKGRKLYDSRLDSTNGGTGSHRYTDHSTWAWSENPALCIADYLMGIRVANSATNSYDGQIIAGMGIAPARIDWASVAAAADDCEDTITINAGGSEDRYTCNGLIDPRRSHRDNLAQLASAMGGQVVFQSGKWSIYAAVSKTATKSRDKDDIIGGISYRAKASRSERVNAVRGIYSAADADHAPKDYPPLINSTYVTEDGGGELWLDINFPMTTSGYTAQRLSKIALERSRRDERVEATFQPVAIQDQAMDAITFTHENFNLSSRKMLVVDWSLSLARDEDGNYGLVVKEVLAGEDDAIYAWTPATEEQAIPASVLADTPTRIADQRLLPSVGQGGAIVTFASNPITATDAGASATINIAASSAQYGWGSVSYNSGAVTSLAYSTKYYIYAADKNLEGGAVTYVATTTKTDLSSSSDRVYFGYVTTPAASAPDTGGGGSPGTEPSY